MKDVVGRPPLRAAGNKAGSKRLQDAMSYVNYQLRMQTTDTYVEWNQRLYSWMLRNLLLPVGDAVFHQNVIPRLRFLERAQWWPREKLHGLRDAQLSELIRTVHAEVPYYRGLWSEHGIRAEDIRSPEDLRQLPIVTKAMLRPAYPQDLTRETGFPTHEESSSGSTGTPFFVM